MTIACKLGFHKFTVWSQLVSTYHGVFQFRYCKCCNKITSREFGNNIKVNLVAWNHEMEVE